MGMNMLGEKNVRFLRGLTGLNIDRASTNSAVESGRWWEFRVVEDDGHWHGQYDRKNGVLLTNEDGLLYHLDEDDDFSHWSTCGDVAAVRVLVTGSGSWTDENVIEGALMGVTTRFPPERITVVHGACDEGADKIADRVARDWGWTIERHPADWSRHGRPAGQIRNERMVKLGADVCLAFIRNNSPGATTTAIKAMRAGIETMVWRADDSERVRRTMPPESIDPNVDLDQGSLF